jgi:hypothetical protein
MLDGTIATLARFALRDFLGRVISFYLPIGKAKHQLRIGFSDKFADKCKKRSGQICPVYL